MHFLAVSAVVFLAVFALIALYWPVLAKEYVMTVEAPPLEDEFGFKAEYVTDQSFGGRASCLLTSNPTES